MVLSPSTTLPPGGESSSSAVDQDSVTMASNRTALLGNCLNRVARETPERSAIRDLRLQLAYLTMQRRGLRVLRLRKLPQPGIGDVVGLVVRARNAFSSLGAQLRTVARGEVVGYTKLLTASRNQARERM